MIFLGLALRNLTRNRRRTAISLALVAVGMTALLLTAGFVRFSFDGLREAMIHGGLGHLEIASAQAVAARGAGALDRSLRQGVEQWQSIQAEVERLPHVLAVGANLQLAGMASLPDGDPVSFVGLGVEPERERRMGFETRLDQGQELADAAPAAGEDRILLARGLAASLGARPGDVVTLLVLDPTGMLSALDVSVAGIITTGVQDLDTRFAKVHLATAVRLLQTERVSNLLVGLDSTDQTGSAKSAIEAALADRSPPVVVTPWAERAPFYGQVRNLYRGIFWFLGSIVFVMVVLATSNTLVMTVMERIREIGTLRAIGTSAGQIAAMIFAEALWLGLFGGLLGAGVGAGATAVLNALELQMPPPPGAANPIDLQLAYVPAAFLGGIALMVVVLAIAAAGPIWKATRLKIVDALGHV